MNDDAARVSALYVYPVKSCRGIEVSRAEIVRRGFARDRRWMLVDAAGNSITQRTLPALCRVRTALADDGIVLETDAAAPLHLPHSIEAGEELSVTLWSHTGPALRHAEGSRWFSRVTAEECSLVYMPDGHERAVDPARAQPSDIVSFADAYPFLLISEASLTDLNARLATKIGMRRFRPNIVVAGVQPFAEDHFTHFRIGGVGFRAVKRCDRCVVTTLDPDSGEAGREPLHTLATYRRAEGKVWFGMNVIHDSTGWLEVGSILEFS